MSPPTPHGQAARFTKPPLVLHPLRQLRGEPSAAAQSASPETIRTLGNRHFWKNGVARGLKHHGFDVNSSSGSL